MFSSDLDSNEISVRLKLLVQHQLGARKSLPSGAACMTHLAARMARCKKGCCWCRRPGILVLVNDVDWELR